MLVTILFLIHFITKVTLKEVCDLPCALSHMLRLEIKIELRNLKEQSKV